MKLSLRKELTDTIEEIQALSNDNTDNFLNSTMPSLLTDFSYVRKMEFTDNHRLLQNSYSLQQCTLLLTHDIPFNPNCKKANLISNLEYLFKINAVHPFMLFVDGKFVKWTDLIIIKDCRYSYILIRNFFMTTEKIQMVRLPDDIQYQEIGTIQDNTIFSFKDGLYYNGRETCVTINDIGARDYYYEQLELKDYIKLNKFRLDPIYEMSKNNIIVFMDGKLIPNQITYYGMNMFVTNNANFGTSNYAIGFYYYKANKRINNRDMFVNKAEAQLNVGLPLPNYLKLFSNNFNAKYSYKLNYNQNMLHILNAIMSYNSGLMNRFYEKINNTISIVYTGKELKALADKDGIVTLSRRRRGTIHNNLIIFHNGELYKYYYKTRHYNKYVSFVTDGIKDDDTVELLFFLNVDNREFPIVLASKLVDNYYIDETIDKDYMKLFTEKTEQMDFEVEITNKKQYQIEFKYAKNPNGTTKIIPSSPYYYDKRLTLVSERQFKYYRKDIDYDCLDIMLPWEDFRFCNNKNQYMLFINGRKIPYSNYRVVVPYNMSPFDDHSIYTNIPLEIGDIVEVFYIPDKLNEVDSDKELQLDGRLFVDKTALKHNLNKHLDFIFINGRKIAESNLFDVDQNMLMITTDIRSTENVSIVQHMAYEDILVDTFNIKEDEFTKAINQLTINDIELLFGSGTTINNYERDICGGEIDMKSVIYSIIKDYYCSPFVTDATDFMYPDLEHYFDYQLNTDSEGTPLIDIMDGNPTNKPHRGRGGISDWKERGEE